MIILIKEEGVSPSPEQLFYFCSSLLLAWLYRHRLRKHRFFVCKGQLMKILGFIFSGDQEKK